MQLRRNKLSHNEMIHCYIAGSSILFDILLHQVNIVLFMAIQYVIGVA